MIKEIKGWHVLTMLICFFGVIFTVNAVFLTSALRTHRGEDEPRSYIQGINYNDVLDRRAEQAELGWQAVSDVTSSGVRLTIQDANGTAISGLVMDARLRHPADSNRDIELDLQEAGAGVYLASADIPDGRWQLIISTPEGPPFELEQDIWLQ